MKPYQQDLWAGTWLVAALVFYLVAAQGFCR